MNRSRMSAKVTMIGAIIAFAACSYGTPASPGDTGPGSGSGSGSSSGGSGGGSGSSSGTTPPGSDGGAVTEDSGAVGEDGGPVAILPVPSHGSAIVFSPDDSLAVATNRDVGSVSVLKLTYPTGGTPTASLVGEVQVGNEPWQVVISPDNSTAYVVLRQDQKVVEVTGLSTSPAVGRSVAVGSEPTGIAMTPTGATVWVANWVDGTLTAVDTASMTVKTTVDLNAPLVQTGYLGTVTPRPALAHPRSLMITNNGDGIDSDESIYATEYFGQVTAPEASNGSNSDTHKSGIVYRVQLSNKAVNTITLGPLADMGFKDQNGRLRRLLPEPAPGDRGGEPLRLRRLRLRVAARPDRTEGDDHGVHDRRRLRLAQSRRSDLRAAGRRLREQRLHRHRERQDDHRPAHLRHRHDGRGGRRGRGPEQRDEPQRRVRHLLRGRQRPRRRFAALAALRERHRLRRRVVGGVRLRQRRRRRVPDGVRRHPGHSEIGRVPRPRTSSISIPPAFRPRAPGSTRSGSRRATPASRSRSRTAK